MIKNWLSRYSPRYPRSLVYMMQASEYVIRDYLAWFHRTQNFTHVERRKRLVKTPKALVLLVICSLIIVGTMMEAISIIWTGTGSIKYIEFFLLLLLAPYILAYGIVIPLLLVQVLIQWPVEYLVMKRVRQKLQAHRAVKIGIAGSFGKTTMREILKTVLSEGEKVAAPPHSYNTPLGISRFVRTLSGDEDILIFELGEYYPGDVRKLCHIVQPTIGIITGINEAHLEKFKTLERTAKTIYELADYLGERSVYVNGESGLAKAHAGSRHLVYDRTGVKDWKVEHEKTDITGTSFTLVKDTTKLELRSALLGLHHIGPFAAAADIGLGLGLSLDQIKKGIAQTKPFAHRLEPKTDPTGVITIDDSYNGNPDGARAAIAFLGSLEGYRRFYVTPGLVEMGTRAADVHQEIGRVLSKAGIEKVVLIKNSVTSAIGAGLQETGYRGEILWFDDALTAFATLPHLTVKGDVVLLQNDWPDQYT